MKPHLLNTDNEKFQQRDVCLPGNGFAVLRFWKNEAYENIEGVLEVIRQKCLYMASPSPSRQGRGI